MSAQTVWDNIYHCDIDEAIYRGKTRKYVLKYVIREKICFICLSTKLAF